MIRLMIGLCARLVIAAFFGFVGTMKAFAPVAMLAAYGAWTVYLPDALGRAVGWSEIACALALLASLIPRLGRLAVWAAILLGANQLVAATVHLAHRESEALP